MEQGSYMMIAKGMTAHGPDGDVGAISEVVADPKADIFRGVVVSRGLFSQTRVLIPAENIIGVHEQIVEVDLTKKQVEELPQAAEVPTGTNLTSA